MKTKLIIAFILLKASIIAQSTINYEYDNLQRLTKVTYPTGSYIQYHYDANGNRTQEVKVYQNLSVDDATNMYNVSVFPNPFFETLHIKSHENEMQEINLYDTNAKLLQTYKVFTFESSLDFSNLIPGVYILEIKTPKGIINQKIIKK